MPVAQCLGRLVRDGPKGIHMLEFKEGGFFHLPIRCSSMAKNGDLCDSCQARDKKTQDKIQEITGTTIGGMLPSYLMGRVSDPIPFWSRLYEGAWYNLKIQAGSTLSEETMAKAKKAAAEAYEGVQAVEPQPMPGGGKKVRATKAAAAKVAEVAEPKPAPVKAAPVKKRQPKVAPTSPIGVICQDELPVEAIRQIKVRRYEVDGRSLYLGPKDKLYDLKFKYLGRLKDDTIISFPDSDEDTR